MQTKVRQKVSFVFGIMWPSTIVCLVGYGTLLFAAHVIVMPPTSPTVYCSALLCVY